MKSHAASVRFESVTKRFGDVQALREVSFEIEPGTLVTLLGPSGCGKTTTLRLIAGLELPSSGTIRIGDEDVSTLPATSRDVTMVFQSYALFPHMSVLENVAYGLRVSGVGRNERRDQALQGLDLVGLREYAPRLPSELSGGQQQRVAVARALVLEPSVLLFDEPLSNLDAKLRRQVRKEIRDLQQELGLTAVYVTHDQEEALAVSDRIIVMRNAAIAQEGTPRELYEEPADLFVADFIGDANVVQASIEALGDERATVKIGGIVRELPHRGLARGPAQVAIRPESVLLSTAGESSVSSSGTVRDAIYLGSHIEYNVQCDLGVLFVIDPRVDDMLAAGTEVAIDLAGHGVSLVRG